MLAGGDLFLDLRVVRRLAEGADGEARNADLAQPAQNGPVVSRVRTRAVLVDAPRVPLVLVLAHDAARARVVDGSAASGSSAVGVGVRGDADVHVLDGVVDLEAVGDTHAEVGRDRALARRAVGAVAREADENAVREADENASAGSYAVSSPFSRDWATRNRAMLSWCASQWPPVVCVETRALPYTPIAAPRRRAPRVAATAGLGRPRYCVVASANSAERRRQAGVGKETTNTRENASFESHASRDCVRAGSARNRVSTSRYACSSRATVSACWNGG